MAYVPPKYPGQIPTIGDLPNRTDDVDWMYAARYNELKKELRAIMIELGVDPAGASADVKTRLGLLAPKASPVFTGDATIPTINLAGGQIKFPASQAASGDANTLDDYEEGSWTPDLQFGGAKVGITYSVDAGYYTKIGRVVICSGFIQLTNKGSSIGEATLAGLPFTVAANDAASAPSSFRHYNISFADVPQGIVVANQTKMELTEVSNAGTPSTLTNANFANNSWLWLSVTYII